MNSHNQALATTSEPVAEPSIKTPWNPSKKALARVKDPLPVPTCCRYCNGTVRIVNHTAIYGGRTYGEWPWVYRCEDCKARVGMHPFTNLPLGTLADNELREVRNRCKKPFERIWEGRRPLMGRTEAYRWLAEKLGKSIAECHFGLFEEEDCERAEVLCVEMLSLGRPALGKSAMASAFQNARPRRG